ncbi:hypothetical protein HZS_4901, partial [Henneguya salminicola]
MNKASAYSVEEVRYISESTLVINLGYIWSVFGILKIIEFILLLICWALVANFQGYYSFPYTIFYLIVTCICWAYVILEYFIYIFNIHKRMNMTVSLAALIAANGLLAYLSRLISDQNISPFFCTCIIVITSCRVIYAACAIGFLAAIVFLIDAYLHYREYQGSYK